MYNEPLSFEVVPGSTADTRIFRLHGPITLSNLFDFQKVLTGGTEKVTILDFTESQYMDSAGLGVILNYYVSGKRHGRTIRLVAVNYRVAELLKLTSANTLIKSYDSIEPQKQPRPSAETRRAGTKRQPSLEAAGISSKTPPSA